MNPAVIIGAGTAFSVVLGLMWLAYQIGHTEGQAVGMEKATEIIRAQSADVTGHQCRACWRPAHRGACAPKWVA